MEKIDINGISLAYTRQGKGTPMALIHGYPLDHTIWADVMPWLEKKFDVILPDVRGFGQSTTVDLPYIMDEMASDIAGLLDYLNIERAVITGHSMGGYVALAFARLYPKRVLGLGMVSSQAMADASDRPQGRYDTAAQVMEKGVGIVADAMTTKLSADSNIQTFVRGLIEQQSPAGLAGALKAMAERIDSTPLLPSFKFPVAIAHGSADALIPVERGHEMKSAISHAKLFELGNVGHMPMMEDANGTAQALMTLQ